MAHFNISDIFLPALISALLRSKLEPIQESTPLNSYDYIVIGSGFGGSIVANRLSENPNNLVLLLEAGSKDNTSTQVPVMTFPLLRNGYDWMYEAVPQKKTCFGMENETCKLSSGKVIGGSSSLGFMFYHRGIRQDFVEWENLGIPGWTYDDVLPFFKKPENYSRHGDCIENELHGCGGELFIGSIPKEVEHYETEYFMEAAKEMGFEGPLDPDGPKAIGAGKFSYTMRNGIRQSAATAFLRPVMTRPNLHISMDSFVHKIIIDPESKVIIGVEFEKDGKMRQIKAKKEIILSAGIYSSPKILMLSGIGPKEILKKFNISVIVDLPGVGQNLQERLGIFVFFNKESNFTDNSEQLFSSTSIKKWNRGTGLLTTPSGLEAVLSLKTKYSNKDSVRFDSIILMQKMSFDSTSAPSVKKSIGYNDKFWNSNLVPYIDQDIIAMHPIIAFPKSKGSVSIRSDDPHDLPLIDPNFFDDENDMKILIEAIKTAANFENTTTFKKHKYVFGRAVVEECKQYKDFLSDEYLACFLKYGSNPRWSGCCSNKIGPDTDSMAVVDHRLRVRGIKGLRISDGSVIPHQMAGLPNAFIVMISEKAAHMIKEDNE